MKKLAPFKQAEKTDINFRTIDKTPPSTLISVYFSLILIFFVVIFLRLFHLTIVKGGYYRRLSDSNRTREIVVEAKRGTIIDRYGLILAENTAADIKDDRLKRYYSHRIYHLPEASAFVVGYRQKADLNDLKNDNCLFKLNPEDKVGKRGIEKIFDCQLRGRPGKKLIEVNSPGDYLRTLGFSPPQEGQTVELAADAYLLQKVYDLMKNKKGAVVALRPSTGEILALVSTPSFNPQFFEDENSKMINSYFKDRRQPMFNRATQAVYPPGSIFKLIVAAAALEEKKIDEKTLFEDTGTISAGSLTFGNWYFLQYGKKEGMLNIVEAIKRSNDIFFYKTGETLGPQKIKAWAQIFGYGRKVDVDFDQSEGLIPSTFWKEEILKEKWYLGDTYNLSIGQGYVLVTPLQVAYTTAVFANGGYLCTPQLLKIQKSKQNCKKLPLSEKTIRLIREGMRQACSPGGTGWPLFNFKIQPAAREGQNQEIQTACKTGTAESHAKSGLPHAWITVFAPFDTPQIVLTVLVEEGGQGSDIAGPIAREILREYFERRE